MSELKNMVGVTIGGVVGLSLSGRVNNRVAFKWRCFCGKTFIRSGADVRLAIKRHGKTSCGCLFIESSRRNGRNNKTHGLSGNKLYDVHRQMMRRCYNPKSHDFPNYGGRGIKVWRSWHSVAKFIEWAGQGFKPGLTIDRIDVNKGYSPENCRWIPNNEQAQTTRRCRRLLYRGETLRLRELAERYGVNLYTLKGRLRRGWPLEASLRIPIGGIWNCAHTRSR